MYVSNDPVNQSDPMGLIPTGSPLWWFTDFLKCIHLTSTLLAEMGTVASRVLLSVH